LAGCTPRLSGFSLEERMTPSPTDVVVIIAVGMVATVVFVGLVIGTH
jgi:hypothetical protein